MANKNGTIFQRIEKKLDGLEKNAERKAEKKIMHQRISEMVRGKSFLEKVELVIKIFS